MQGQVILKNIVAINNNGESKYGVKGSVETMFREETPSLENIKIKEKVIPGAREVCTVPFC